MRLGPHLPDGSFVEVEVHHAGSRLRLRSTTEGEVLVGEIEAVELVEWGLRFWPLLEFGFMNGLGVGGEVALQVPEGEARYILSPVAVAKTAKRSIAFSTAPRPVAAHLYDDAAEALEELERFGYYHRPPSRHSGGWTVFRFNFVTPKILFAVAPAENEDAARSAIDHAIGKAEVLLEDKASTASTAPRRAAVRDAVAWNTVWDRARGRSYTTSTRAWVAGKFGGWFVWQIDSFFHAMLAAHVGDPGTARANLEAAMDCRTESGMLAALRSPLTDWIDRSHPPIGAHAVWHVAARLDDDGILDRCFPVLIRAFEWWFERRDGNGNGLLEYGSSPVGDGHFVHTKLAAMDESANDNSPVYDEAEFDERAHTLDCEDVGLNSLLVHEGEILALMGDRLGRAVEAERLRDRIASLSELVRTDLWDDRRGIFANRLWSGLFVGSLAPTSFYPLLAGIASPDQAERMVRDWLLDPSRFWGPFPVAGTPHEDPASLDNVYWRGRVWPPMNYLVYRGLRRYRFDDEASELASKGAAMFEREWAGRRCFENFNQRTGEGGDSVDADLFYTWGALLPMLADVDLLDLDPFDGLTFGAVGGNGSAELLAGARRWQVEVGPMFTRLTCDGEPVLEAAFGGRFRRLQLGSGGLSVEVPSPGGRIRFASAPLSAHLDGVALVSDASAVELPRGEEGRTLEIRLASPGTREGSVPGGQ